MDLILLFNEMILASYLDCNICRSDITLLNMLIFSDGISIIIMYNITLTLNLFK